MKNLYQYILENEHVNEGLITNTIANIALKKIEKQELIDGLLNMLDYIGYSKGDEQDKNDIKLFIRDFPVSQRVFWKNLYKMYKGGVWSIVEIDDKFDINEFASKLGIQLGGMFEINSSNRRYIRDMIKSSGNIDPVLVDRMGVFTYDDKNYLIVINRIQGAIKRIIRAIDMKFLLKIFEKITL